MESISAHSTILRALGGLGAELMQSSDWKERLVALAQIDWSKKNPDWQNVCIIANSVVSNRQARAATKSHIKSRLGMDLTEAEERSIQTPLRSAAARTAPEVILGLESAHLARSRASRTKVR